MTSSQPIATPNALNYTPDNLAAYAYSGPIATINVEKILLLFNTESGYIVGTWRGEYIGSTNADYSWILYFNDVALERRSGASKYEQNINRDIIIPPFTAVKITGNNIEDDSSNNIGALFVGRAVGMTETGFQ